MNETSSKTVYKFEPKRISRKDLVAVARFLKRILKKYGIEHTINTFKDYLRNQRYIKTYTYGAHHSGLGPSRRPLKVYSYVIKNLTKILKDVVKKERSLKLIGVKCLSTCKYRGGIRRYAKGRANSENSRNYYMCLFYNSN